MFPGDGLSDRRLFPPFREAGGGPPLHPLRGIEIRLGCH